MNGMLPVLLPAIGALAVLSLDLLGKERASDARGRALAGIRLGVVAGASLVGVALALRFGTRPAGVAGDAFTIFGAGFVVVAGALVLGLALTHLGMARSRAAEPIALLLFAWAGSMAAIATTGLVPLFLALELAALPVIALVAIDTRRLSSSESSLKSFFAHAFASLVFAQGLGFVFGATGRLDFDVMAGVGVDTRWVFEFGITLLVVGLLARAAVAPFHPWAPDVHEGAPSFVTAHFATIAQATVFLVLLRLLQFVPAEATSVNGGLGERLPYLFLALGGLGLVWGHAMALVQVGLRRLVGWLAVGQVGFLTLALMEAKGEGASAILWALIATGAATIGVMATFSSMSHHERVCERIGDLAGMVQTSPLRAAMLGAFLLSLGGLPGTIGFVARFRILSALEGGVHPAGRVGLVLGLMATVLAFAAIGRPLLAMMRPEAATRPVSRALTNEQVVLGVCGLIVVVFGLSPVLGETNMAGQLAVWIERAVSALRR